jgi:hypothetical protein
MEISTQGNAAQGRAGSQRGFADRVEAFALAQPTKRVAAVVFTGIAIMAILGTFERLGWGFSLFDLDGEGKPAPAWSALVLAGAGTLALLLSRADRRDHRLPWLVLGSFFLFMAVDECITLHESAELATDVDWQYLWAPIILVGGIAWLQGLRRSWPLVQQRALLLGGATLWVISQIDEHFQSNPDVGRVEGYKALSAIEEIFEVTGSALFLLALLGVLKAVANRDRRLAESPE